METAKVIQITSKGVSYLAFSKHRETATLFWENVVSITVFKRDLFSFDLICLSVKSTKGEQIEFDEEDKEWKLLLHAISQHLDTNLKWSSIFAEVAFPAFEQSPVTIFSR